MPKSDIGTWFYTKLLNIWHACWLWVRVNIYWIWKCGKNLSQISLCVYCSQKNNLDIYCDATPTPLSPIRKKVSRAQGNLATDSIPREHLTGQFILSFFEILLNFYFFISTFDIESAQCLIYSKNFILRGLGYAYVI